MHTKNTINQGTKDWEYQIVYQRGIEAMVWAVPAVSMLNFRKAYFGLGGGYNTVVSVQGVSFICRL